jgi:hypothetical protein
VSAVIVRGKLPNPQQAKLWQLADMWPQQERTVVVPAEGVDFVTSAVFLTLTALECAQLPDFNPADFATPDAAWEPPFPYHREEVLLDLGCSRELHLEASQRDVVLAERDQSEALVGQLALPPIQ